MAERKAKNGPGAMERGRAKELKVVRRRLMLVTSLPPGAMVTSVQGLLSWAMSGSVVPP